MHRTVLPLENWFETKKGKGWEVSSYNAEHVNCVSIGVPKSTHIAHVGKLLSSCGRLQCLYDCHIIVWHSLGTSDGENRDVLVAFAVVPAESAADYIWFIKNMKHSAQLNTWLNEKCMRLFYNSYYHLYLNVGLVLITDRGKGLKKQ